MAHGSRQRSFDKQNGSKLMRVLISFITLCLVFMLGFFVRGNNDLMDYMGIKNVTNDEERAASVSMDPKSSLTARVAELQSLLDKESYAYDYDLDDVSSQVLSSFIKAADDGYMRYCDAKEYEALRSDNATTYSGIGVLLGSHQNKAYVVEVFEGSDAQAKGVQTGDFIVSIDGMVREDGWTLTEAINAIGVKTGHVVSVTWRRPASLEDSGGEQFHTNLVCSDMAEENVTHGYHNKVGYIKVRQLGRTTSAAVRDAIGYLKEKGSEAYVLDLRNIPGGYLTQAVEIASLFQESGVVVQVQTRMSVTSKSVAGKVVTDAPLVILVNKNTAAAAEVLAAALQDSGRATVVGETSMGKGSVQVIREFSFGGAVSYTAAYYKTPRGRDIDSVGIDPDVKVFNSAGSSAVDYQKRVALNIARSLIEK